MRDGKNPRGLFDDLLLCAYRLSVEYIRRSFSGLQHDGRISGSKPSQDQRDDSGRDSPRLQRPGVSIRPLGTGVWELHIPGEVEKRIIRLEPLESAD